MSARRWLVMDTETTGLLRPSSVRLADQPKIIELALIELRHQGDEPDAPMVVTNEASWLINPGEPLSPEIVRITGLTDDALRGAPPFAAVMPELLPWFLGAHGLIAHNAPFDLGMLVNELRRLGKEHAWPYPPEQLCTVAHYLPAFGRRAKLTEVYQRVLGKPLPQKHRALDDARALVEIVLKDGLAS